MHQSASISQRYVGMKTMVFVTFRWGNAAKRLGSDAPLMHFSPQRDVVGRCYFAGLKVTKRNQATVLLTLTLFQTPTLTLILTPTLFLT